MAGLIAWYGGKGNMKGRLLPLLESIPHRFYCEPFGGGASMLLNKRPVDVETYNDIDGGLYDFFSVMADPALFRHFYRLVKYLPWSRRFYQEYLSNWQNEQNRVKRVAMWFLVARQSFSGRFGINWSSSVTSSGRDRAGTTSRWQSALTRLPEFHERLARVQIENADWRVILERYDTPDTLFYCDPPYLHSTRSNQRYSFEMTDTDHRELVEKLLQLEGKAVLSGYEHEIYQPLVQAGWRREAWQTSCHAAGKTRASGLRGKGVVMKKQARTEIAWVSPCERGVTISPLGLMSQQS